MIFKDRKQAGEKLAKAIQNEFADQDLKNTVVISLLRGGFPIGKTISKRLKISHLLLASVKISSPTNPEYALGALCFDKIYTPPYADRAQVETALPEAEEKFQFYCQRFHLNPEDYIITKGKTILLADDGIATGATAEAAALFLRQYQPKDIIIAVPVAPADYQPENFDDEIILHKDPDFYSVSQFYKEFPQVSPQQILSQL